MTIKDVVYLLYRARDSFSSIQTEVLVRVVTQLGERAHEIYNAERSVKSTKLWLSKPTLTNIAYVFKFRRQRSFKTQTESVWTEKLWLIKPSRWRKEFDNGFCVINGDWWWAFYKTPKPRLYTNKLPIGCEKHARAIESVNVSPKSVEQAISEELWLDPAWLLAFFKMELIGEGVYLDRNVVMVRALPKVPIKARNLDVPFCEADELELWIDKERGILLYLSAKYQTTEYKKVQIKKVEFDVSIEETLFAFPLDLKGELYYIK